MFVLDFSQHSDAQLRDLCLDHLARQATPEHIAGVLAFVLDWLTPDPTLEITTSGTTGAPKTIVVNKSNMVASARMTLDHFQLQPGDPVLHCLAANFIAGKMMVVRALVGRLQLLITSPSEPLPISRCRIKFAAMVPAQLSPLLSTQQGIAGLNTIDTLLLGGAAIPQQLTQQLQTLKCQCVASYGMTETLSHIALRKVNGPQRNEWFTLLPGVEIAQDDRACLHISAPAICAEPIQTNDIVEVLGPADWGPADWGPADRGPAFRVLGRFDNVINSGGVKLSPEALEAKIGHLFSIPFILTGVAHPRWGQSLALVIESQQVDAQQAQSLLARCQELLKGAERPRVIYVVPSLPRNANGKVLRRQLALSTNDVSKYSLLD